MADRRGLGILGFCLGGVTAAVLLIAVMVVKNHLDGRLAVDGVRMPVIAASAQSFIR
jgi:dienelactone hydrolase